MKIAVVAANGKAGQLIVKEAVNRGHDVTAVVRGENRTTAPNAIVKNAFDLTTADLAGFDVVVDAFGTWTPDTLPQIAQAAGHLADLLSGTDTRLIVVGGAGSLFVNKEHTMALEDTPEFVDAYKPVSAAHVAALKLLRNRNDVKWTYVSPAADFQAEGERTGSYGLAGEEFTTNVEGKSFISYADYAIAVVDEAESGKHVGERISVYTK
ncbi:NAD(P)-dependent oxidoreductase [Bifidobacterium moukalabense]|uniref:NAD(P)-dependent oxidoreductase n=1 Tax=Bifidobacterium moukalabense TaxID=1333651 RepID=UPI0010F90EEB|nr:NAD(P)H-binding protein [Bifidobacterium moukalabense]